MQRRHLATMIINAAFAAPAFAQATRDAPDFSPMTPRDLDGYASSRTGSEQDELLLREERRQVETTPYGVPAPVDTAPTALPRIAEERTYYAPAPRSMTSVPPTTRDATIGNGLFNRAGPNDFGA
jgi:hypothetical protein